MDNINNSQNLSIDVNNLCSRKLWEMLTQANTKPLSTTETLIVTTALIDRKHYLKELQNWQQGRCSKTLH